jgi:hypothetical protein
MDATKYLLTVGVIGGALTEKFSVAMALALFVIAVVVFVIGFYTILAKKEKQ